MAEEVLTVTAKHIFLDVVDFSRDRSVEAQSYIVAFLNKIVLLSLSENNITEAQRLLLPTGDGICISLLNVVDPYDIHLRIALSIIKYIDHFRGHSVEHIDEASADSEKAELVLVSDSEDYLSWVKMREFEVRIGIETNVDNLVTDVNGLPNIAGAGINIAQRIMGLADGSQVLVSQTVFNELRHREKYMRSFRELPSTTVKHGTNIKTYQFIGEDCEGLNKDRPTAFEVTQQQPKTLTKEAAYYFAHSIIHRTFLLERDPGSDDYAGEVFLWLLAKDSVAKSDANTEREKVRFNEYRIVKKTIEDFYKELDGINFSILSITHESINSIVLSDYTQFFEGYSDYRFLTSDGIAKLKQEWPQIWEELDLDAYLATT
jgi:hypothetical protein